MRERPRFVDEEQEGSCDLRYRRRVVEGREEISGHPYQGRTEQYDRKNMTRSSTGRLEHELGRSLKITQTHVHRVGDAIQPSHPLLLLPSIFPSIRVFSNESVLPIRWPKYWSFSFNISPSNEHPGLISFRMDWLDLPAVQGTLKSLLQQHSSKASILWRSAFFLVHLSHPYMTTGKTIALTRRTLLAK